MENIMKIPLLGVITCLSISAFAEEKNSREFPRSKRSFGFSNPIFSRVFNPYDNRPLAQKFFGDDYSPVHEDGPQYYPLWHSQPILSDEDEDTEDYPRRHTPGYIPLRRKFAELYPAPSKPYPTPSKPYPAPSKPYSVPSKPYSAPSKPYSASSKHYLEARKPVPSKPSHSTIPCPEPEKPHQQSWKPVIGRLFVDEVKKNLHFERDPHTGNLVPVITEEKNDYHDHDSNHFLEDQTERNFETHESTSESLPITALIGEEEPEKEFGFKLLPHYDIRTKFKTSISSNLLLTPKLNKVDLEERQREKERILWKLEKQRKFEEGRKKIMEGIYGEEEENWPAKLSEAAFEVNTKSVESTSHDIPNSFKSLPNFVIRNKFSQANESPKFTITVLPVQASQNQSQKVVQEKSPELSCQHRASQGGRPCSTKTLQKSAPNRLVQILASTQPSQATEPTLQDVFVPHSTRNNADYTQFLAPPSATMYKKFKKFSLNTQRTSARPKSTKVASAPSHPKIITIQPVVQKFPSTSPSRTLPFRVFKNQLDQSVLDRNGRIDSSKLEQLTQTIVVEPVNRKDFLTLDAAPKNLNFVKNEEEESSVFSTYGLPSAFIESPKINSTFDILTGTGGKRKPQNNFGVGDFPLDKHQFWDSEVRDLKNSYGEASSIRK